MRQLLINTSSQSKLVKFTSPPINEVKNLQAEIWLIYFARTPNFHPSIETWLTLHLVVLMFGWTLLSVDGVHQKLCATCTMCSSLLVGIEKILNFPSPLVISSTLMCLAYVLLSKWWCAVVTDIGSQRYSNWRQGFEYALHEDKKYMYTNHSAKSCI